VKAINTNHVEGVRAPLQNGANPNYVHYDYFDQSMLMSAAIEGNCDIIDVLVQHGAHINFATAHGSTA